MYQHGFVVPPLSKRDIYTSAAAIRSRFARLVGDDPRLPLEVVYEVLPQLLPGFRFESCFHSEMGDDHGRTFPERLLVQLREDVYDGMCNGVGRDRFTGAHELGHLFLHAGAGVALARIRDLTVPAYRNSEWQADTFASALLIDEARLGSCRSLREVAHTFGVSEAAARMRYRP